jgi:hypothetical protein
MVAIEEIEEPILVKSMRKTPQTLSRVGNSIPPICLSSSRSLMIPQQEARKNPKNDTEQRRAKILFCFYHAVENTSFIHTRRHAKKSERAERKKNESEHKENKHDVGIEIHAKVFPSPSHYPHHMKQNIQIILMGIHNDIINDNMHKIAI